MKTALQMNAAEQVGRYMAMESRERIAQREIDMRAAWDAGFDAGKDGRFIALLVGVFAGGIGTGVWWFLSSFAQ